MITLINANGEELDYDGKDIGITKQAINVYELKIKGSFSKTFTIPNNAHNRRILDYYGSQQLSSGALRKQSFSVVKRGNVLLKGDVIIESSDKETISIYFVSGNSSWFNLFQFNCRDIRSARWNTQWNAATDPYTLRTRDQGIVFPLIDWCFKNEKANRFFNIVYTEDSTGEKPGAGFNLRPGAKFIPHYFPCIYLKTLVNEIFIHAGVKLTGDILSDALYNKIILTHDGPDMVNPETGQEISRSTNASGDLDSPTITIATMAPNMKAIELIKWLSVTFGTTCDFIDVENTLEINLTDKFKIEEAEDWSQYFVESESDWSDVKATNIIKTATNEDDARVKDYNKNNNIKFGELGIESGKDDGSERTVYTSPFPVTLDGRSLGIGGDASQNRAIRMQSPFVPFFTLEDDQLLEYTSVVNTVDVDSTGNTMGAFTGTGFPFSVNNNKWAIIRLEDSTQKYTNGYYGLAGQGVTYPSATGFELWGAQYTGTSTGRAWTQRVRVNTPGVRALIHIPDMDVTKFMTNVVTANPFLRYAIGTAQNSIGWAYSVKSSRTQSDLNAFPKSMTFGRINMPDFNEPTLQESNMAVISNTIRNPLERSVMLLPISVFQKFRFNKFVYINTEKLNGYFIVNKIENYVDGSIPVKVELARAL